MGTWAGLSQRAVELWSGDVHSRRKKRASIFRTAVLDHGRKAAAHTHPLLVVKALVVIDLERAADVLVAVVLI
jgi:hypothetical protein